MRLLTLFLAALVPRIATATPPRVVPLGWNFVNVYAVVGDTGTVLVDTHRRNRARRILRRMEKAGLDPDDVRLIVITHAHPDHSASAAELAEALEVPVLTGLRDLDAAWSGHTTLHPTDYRGHLLAPLIRRNFPEVEPTITIDGPFELEPYGVDGTVLPVGGHTSGSVAVRLDGGDVLVGDLIRGRLLRHRAPTLHYFHEDMGQTHAALRRLLPGARRILPGHGGPLDPAAVDHWLDVQAPVAETPHPEPTRNEL